ncbi:MAG TPA: HAMP domain-containing sensor histidine kinase, partial [Polyangiaceae bacterium]|nr:HAMP domain-containing sensor histidine kinase [Polyangiaceae bacterium]
MPLWMRDFLFSSQVVAPSRHQPWLIGVPWVQIAGDLLIGLAYLAIAVTLGYLVWRGRDVPFKRMAVAFGAFIVAAGLTHFLDALASWQPFYYLGGALRVLTAVAAVGAAVMLPRLVPEAIALAKGARAARERGVALETMVNELGQMYEKARAADVMKSRLFANLSHELRTPLALVLGPTERMASAQNLAPDQRRDLEVVIRNARTLLKHVNDLLDVARIEAGRLELMYFDTDVAELARGALSHFATVAEDRGIELALNLNGSEALSAEVDSDKIERVLLNLLSNAFKVTPKGGSISCSLRAADGEKLVLEVADSGPGVPSTQREHIFERFAQIDD